MISSLPKGINKTNKQKQTKTPGKYLNKGEQSGISLFSGSLSNLNVYTKITLKCH